MTTHETLEEYLTERRTKVLGWAELGSAAKDLWQERTTRSYYLLSGSQAEEV